MASVPLARPAALTELGQATLRRLMRVWFEFERGLATVPIIRRLDLGTFTRAGLSKPAVEPASAGDRRIALDQSMRLELRPRSFGYTLGDSASCARRASRLRDARGGLRRDRRRDRANPRAAQEQRLGGSTRFSHVSLRRAESFEHARGDVDHRGARREDGRELGRAHRGADRIRFALYAVPALSREQRRLAYGQTVCVGRQTLHVPDAAADAVVSTAQIVGRFYAWQLEEIDDGLCPRPAQPLS